MFIGVSPLRELDGTNLVKADCEVIQPGFHRTLEIPRSLGGRNFQLSSQFLSRYVVREEINAG
jgi:hypothetical protein